MSVLYISGQNPAVPGRLLIILCRLDFFPSLIVYLVVAFVSSAILAIIVDFLVFRPLRNKQSTALTLMIASIGVSFVVRFMIDEFYGSNLLSLQIPGQPGLNSIKLFIIILAVVFVVILDLIITRTKLGKAMRAVSDNPKLAQASGISLYR